MSNPKTSRAPLIALLLALAVPGSLTAWWLVPRPAEPAEMPPFVVPRVAALTSIATALAPAARDEGPRRDLYIAHGLAELHMDDSPAAARTRAEALSAAADALEAAGTLEAARAFDVARGVALLYTPGDGTEAERGGELGAFPSVLERYGAVIAGRRVAPDIVVHALFWARWNAIHNRELTDGMDATVLRGYHGWLAYYGARGGTELRSGALLEYVRAGGLRGYESEAYLRMSGGDIAGARLALDEAYARTGNVRLRNQSLALSVRDGELE